MRHTTHCYRNHESKCAAMKTDELFTPRFHALVRVPIMDKAPYEANSEVHKPTAVRNIATLPFLVRSNMDSNRLSVSRPSPRISKPQCSSSSSRRQPFCHGSTTDNRSSKTGLAVGSHVNRPQFSHNQAV